MSNKKFCKYHSDEPAIWNCNSCDIFYGDCCAPTNEDNTELPICPLCINKLTYLGQTNSVVPFEQKLSFFTSYGFQKPLLIYCFVLFIFAQILEFFIGTTLTTIVVYCCIAKYAATILVHVSQGNEDAPELSDFFQGEGFALFFKFAILFLLIFASTAASKSTLLIIIQMLSFSILLPIVIITIVIENSFFAMFNIEKVFKLLGAIGWRYFILWLFLFLIMSSATYVPSLLAPILIKLHPLLFTFLFLEIYLYFLTTMFSMMGYVVFQYQSSAETGNWSHLSLPKEQYHIKKALAHSEIYMREARPQNALKTLTNGLIDFPNNICLHERYHNLQLICDDSQQGSTHLVNQFLPLIIKNQPEKTVSLYLNAINKWQTTLPQDPVFAEQLAKLLLQKNQTKQGLELLLNTYKNNQKSSNCANILMLATKAYLMLENYPVANKMLTYIKAQFPQLQQHPAVLNMEKDISSHL